MAAVTAKKPSAAYDKGYREGRADKGKKKPARMMEAPEGEEKESPEEEEEMDAAKGRKRDGGYMKTPMDGEGCSCGAKGRKGKKCSCDGGCGYGKKMDSLTAPEYLDACDLGIQGRSRSYIRARLDATERLDLKCGNGSISKGEKCSKGAGTTARSSHEPSIRRGIKTGAKYGAVINGIAGVAQGAALGGLSGGGLRGVLQGAVSSGLINTASGAVLGGAIGGGVNAVRKVGYRASRRARRSYDSVWADGFEPRNDLKCGNGAISQGEKCHVGAAKKAEGPGRIEREGWYGAQLGGNAFSRRSQAKRYGAFNAATGAVVGGVTGYLIGGARGAALGAAGGGAYGGALGAGIGAGVAQVNRGTSRMAKRRRLTREFEAPIASAYKNKRSALQSSGASRSQIREHDMKTAMKLAEGYDRIQRSTRGKFGV